MGIGAQSALWRRVALRALSSTYLRRRIRTADGTCELYVSGGSSLKVLDPRGVPVDPPHARFIRDWVGANAVVWDIGCNLGLFAFPAALKARAGIVYGFEADVELAARLLKSRRLPGNTDLNVNIFCLAVSDSDGTASFQISRFSRAMNRLSGVGSWNDHKIAADETRSVATLRIDTLVQSLRPPTAIKIDVEGAEMHVLEGGAATIDKYRPAMLVEGPSELWEPMGAFFRKHDYVLLDCDVEHPEPLDHPVWDTLALPREKYLNRA